MDSSQQSPSKYPGTRVLRLFVYTASTGLFLIIMAVLGVYLYQDEIKGLVVRKLNQHLRAEVRIAPQNIDVTFIRSFPYCSVQFKDALMLEATRSARRDTLFFTKTLQLKFSLLDIWHQKYVIKKLLVEDMVLKPRVFKDGSDNYQFWNTGNGTSNDTLAFLLNEVQLNRVRVIYRNSKEEIGADLYLKNALLAGNFRNETSNLTGNLKGKAIEFKTREFVLTDKTIESEFKLIVDGNLYRLTEAKFAVNDLNLSLSGEAVYDQKIEQADLKLNASDLDMYSLLSLIPEENRKALSDYESGGKLYIEGYGKYNGALWSAGADFGAEDAIIRYVPGDVAARKVNLKGKLEWSEASSRLLLDGFYAELGDGKIQGSFEIRDFRRPLLRAEAQADLRLQKLHEFIPLDTFETLTGEARVHVKLAGLASRFSKEMKPGDVDFFLEMVSRDVAVRFKHDPKTYKISSGRARANNSEVQVNDLAVQKGSSDMILNGRMPGLLSYLFGQDVPLTIEGSLKSDKFSFDDFIPQENKSNSQVSGEIIPAKVKLDLTVQVSEMSFGKFKAGNIKGRAEINNRKLMLSEVKLETMHGKALLNALADNSAGDLKVSVESTLEKIDVSQLFEQMNDFGQSTLTREHIKGIATATVVFSGRWNSKLESDLSSIRSNCDLVIDKGQLVGFSPLKSLGKFIDVKELDNVRFATLSSKVLIADQKISIPRTAIKNSAINIDFTGSHTFSHNIDYHFQLLLSDLLAARRRENKEEEFGAVARDAENRRSLFILMTGNLNDPRIRYDRQGLQQKIRTDLLTEKQNLKNIVREEFGLSTEGKKKEESAPVFMLEDKKPAPKKVLILKKKEEEDF